MTKSFSSLYQVAIVAPGSRSLAGTLRGTLKSACTQLGLSPSVLRFLDEHSLADVDPALPLTAVYFGGAGRSSAADRAVMKLRAGDVSILPVVASLTNYKKQMPTVLHPINGYARIASDTTLAGVSNYVLQQLGLVRRERMAFISYKRTEARHAALQIYHGLDERSWGVFLDTHFITPGVEFQDALWDKMANADVLLLLDSPGVLSSSWVQQELARAHDLGMGVLQLIWPTQTRTPGTEFCEPEYLDESDFSGSFSSPGGARLRAPALRRIMTSIERVRAKALAARRNRLVRDFCVSATAVGTSVTVQPGGEVEVRGYCLIPVVGHPSSEHVHEASKRADAKHERLMVLFDAAGSLSRRLDHLRWLNKHLPIQTLPVHESRRWLLRSA